MSDIEDNDSRQASAPPEDDAMSDHDSDILSDVDVGDLEEYDPLKANIEQRPVDIDEDVAKSLKATKRKRAEGETAKRPKEGRRPKKRRTEDGDEVSAADGTIIEGKRRRAGAGEGGGGEKKAKSRSKRPTPEPENDEHLTPEQRRARAIEKAMDAAIKGKSNKRRTKKDEVVCHFRLPQFTMEVRWRDHELTLRRAGSGRGARRHHRGPEAQDGDRVPGGQRGARRRPRRRVQDEVAA